MRLALLALALLALAQAARAEVPQPTPAERALHERLLTLDTHLDSGLNFARPGWDILQRHTPEGDLSQLDLPRMVEGGLGGGFFDVYTPSGPLTAAGYAAAREHAFARLAAIRETVAAHADRFALATTADDAARIAAGGRRFVFLSIENSYPLGDDVSLLSTFRRLGVRMAGPTHFKANQLADSATDAPAWHGLSPAGKRFVAEANRLGIVIDVSHSSDEAFDQMLALSKTPLIASHSGVRAMLDHPRNLDDGRLRKLAAAGGVIQMNTVYLVPPDHDPEGDKLGDRLDAVDTLSPAEQARLVADFRAHDAAHPPVRAPFELFMKALSHAIAVAGIDHVGIGADWDGGGGTQGLADVADLPRITAALHRAGYSDADIQKVWSGNALRVLRAAEAYAASLPTAGAVSPR